MTPLIELWPTLEGVTVGDLIAYSLACFLLGAVAGMIFAASGWFLKD